MNDDDIWNKTIRDRHRQQVKADAFELFVKLAVFGTALFVLYTLNDWMLMLRGE